MKRYYKTPEILEAKDGVITSVKRYDGAVISVGMETHSGGKILTIKADTNAVGNMCAEIGRHGVYTAIAAISL